MMCVTGVRVTRNCAPYLALLGLAFVGLLLTGCSAPRAAATASDRQFTFGKDTFAYSNELVWEYGFDEKGAWSGAKRQPGPDYSLHCFVMARAAAQFFEYATFDPALPAADEATYRRRVGQVVNRSIRKHSPASEKIVFPGYANLHDFSRDHERLLKAECGSAVESYFQRGHWRMIFPFSRGHQKSTASELARELGEGEIAIVHLVRFPKLTINHAVLVYGVSREPNHWVFLAYDPNNATQPLLLTYDSKIRTFLLSPSDYFAGGRVDVYQVYHRWYY